MTEFSSENQQKTLLADFNKQIANPTKSLDRTRISTEFIQSRTLRMLRASTKEFLGRKNTVLASQDEDENDQGYLNEEWTIWMNNGGIRDEL